MKRPRFKSLATSSFSGHEKTKQEIDTLYQSPVSDLADFGGIRPAMRGRPGRGSTPALRLAKNASGLRFSSHFSNAAEIPARLSLPPAAAGRNPPGTFSDAAPVRIPLGYAKRNDRPADGRSFLADRVGFPACGRAASGCNMPPACCQEPSVRIPPSFMQITPALSGRGYLYGGLRWDSTSAAAEAGSRL